MKDELIHNKYRILKTLGQNDFSDTFLATGNRWFHSYRRYVIKKFRPRLGSVKAEEAKRLFHQEADILQRLGDNNRHNRQIPRLHECFTDGENFYLVREWIDGITLQQKVERQGKLAVAEVEQILDSILHFLEYIHSHGIIYCQLKPSTFVLRDWQSSKASLPTPIYFGGVEELKYRPDFKRRKLIDRDHQEYFPPEQKQGKLTFASDLYSLGLTAIYLLTGKNPTELPQDRRTKKILWHQEIPELKIHLVRVLDRAISPHFARRYNLASEMLEALHSPPVNLALPAAQPKSQKTKIAPELTIVSWLLAASIGVLGLTFAILRLDLNRDRDPLISSFQRDRPIAENLITGSTSSESGLSGTPIPAFPLGKPQQMLIDTLGKPTKNSKGYWQNSRAFLYDDVISTKITLGYSIDTETSNIRQAEISFASSVDLATIQLQAKQLLQDNYSSEIKEYIDRVYSKASESQNFQIGEIKGVIQRGAQDTIFLAIWDDEFH